MSARALVDRLHRRLRGQSLSAILVRGTTGGGGAQLAGALVALLSQLVLARLLDVSHYGYYVYALTWILILSQLCRLGFHNSLIRFVAGYRASADWSALRGLVVRSVQLVLAAAAVAAAAVAAIAWLLRERMPEAQLDTFLVAAIALVPLALLGVAQGVLQGYRRTWLAFLPVRVFPHGGTLLLVLLVIAPLGMMSAPVTMVATLAAALVGVVVSLRWVAATVRGHVAGVAPSFETRYWITVSLPMLLMAAMQVLLRQTDTVMVGAITGTDAAGLYFPAARISELAAFGLMSANAIVAPMISELHTQRDRGRLQRLLTLAAMGVAGLTLAGALALVVLGEWVLGLFGDAFEAAYPALLILLAGKVVSALCGPVGYIMTMTGHQNRAALVQGCAAVLNVALNAALIPLYGLVGAALATSLCLAAWNVWLLIEVWRREGLNPTVFARWPRLRA